MYVCILRFLIFPYRYFTGHTTDSKGTVQFVKGQTSVKSAIFGSVKILTIAVSSAGADECLMYLNHSCFVLILF
jgi:hypothetical protein